MPSPRFFCPGKLALGAMLELPENAARHATKALRLKVGDTVYLFNGDGHDYTAELLRANKDSCHAKITGQTEVDKESPLRIMLAQAI